MVIEGVRFSNHNDYPTRYEALDAAFKNVLKVIVEENNKEEMEAIG